MKRITLLILVLLMSAGLFACGDLTAYDLDDFIPPLMSTDTQLPYVEKIVVTESETGETVEFTEGADHNKIRMLFEEMKCIRREKSPDVTTGFTVSFVTTAETVDMFIPVEEGAYQAGYVYIGGYEFELLSNGVDTFFFASLFEE